VRLRKFGGRCVLGFQSIGQVSALYGRGDAQTLVENCGNTLILRCSASEGGGTALFASQLIGQREVLRRHVSRTDARDGTSVRARRRRSTTESDQVIIENRPYCPQRSNNSPTSPVTPRPHPYPPGTAFASRRMRVSSSLRRSEVFSVRACVVSQPNISASRQK
jgi:hypothetical protein